MAIGDDAAAAGYPLVAGTANRRLGYEEINKTRDLIAQLKTWASTTFVTLATLASDYMSRAELTAGYYPRADIDFIHSGAHSTLLVKSDGPSATAYGRSATGGGWFPVYMNNALQFMRSTSSRRYKTQERPLTLDPARILAMVPTTYHRKGQPRGTRELGLIAEDLAALDLPHIVSWGKDAQGNEVPEAVRYEQVLPVMLLHVCRAQQAQIDELREQLNTNKEA